MKLSDSKIANDHTAPDAYTYASETVSEYLLRGGTVTQVVPGRVRDYRAAKIRINASRNVQVNYNHPVNKG